MAARDAKKTAVQLKRWGRDGSFPVGVAQCFLVLQKRGHQLPFDTLAPSIHRSVLTEIEEKSNRSVLQS